MTKNLLYILMISLTFSVCSMDKALVCEESDVEGFFQELAVENPSVETLQGYLDKGVALSIKKYISDEYGLCSALKIACIKGKPEVVTFLIERGADAALKDDNEITLLHIAAEKGHADVCSLLLDAGLLVNVRTFNGATALHFAVISGDLPTCELLIEHGAKFGIKAGADEDTPIAFAAKMGRLALVQLFFEKHYCLDPFLVNLWNPHSDKHRSVFRALAGALEYNQQEVFTYLVNASNLHSCRYTTLLYLAANYGYADCCKQLLKKGARISEKIECDGNRTPLHVAAEHNYADVFRLLVLRGADIYAVSEVGTPLQVAQEHNSGEAYKLLELSGACRQSGAVKALYVVSKAVGKVAAVGALALFLL